MAIKTQRMKHALTQVQHKYFLAWISCTVRAARSISALVPALQPIDAVERALMRRSSWDNLMQDLEKLLAPSSEQILSLRARTVEYYTRRLFGSRCWWEGHEWVLSYHENLPSVPGAQDAKEWALTSFWCRLDWNDNPWILDPQGKPLKCAKLARVLPCHIRDLHIQRTGPREFFFTLLSLSKESPRHMHLKP
uniref:RxLR effector candidate protein n=1 Tax=Hyaloperonospora arabidopsidis (strain Emoy2) TaxID=559515 RepID=M4BHS5_HYAAE